MSEETPESLIPYDEIVQEALRDVVGRVLREVEQSGGLPGGHHFYITFKTKMPGVSIPKQLVERFPDEMTIVIQHQFWDLKITESHFEIGLSFSDVPEKLVIPFNAIRGFYDPSVNFELEFDVPLADGEELPSGEITAYPVDAAAKPDEAAGAKPGDGEEKKPGSVVSLDSFRKKQ